MNDNDLWKGIFYMKIHRRQFLGQLLAISTAGPSLLRAETSDKYSEWKKELSRHRLIDLGLTVVSMKYPRLVGKNSIRGIHGKGSEVLVCQIKTQLGVTGWGAFLGRREEAADVLSRLKGKSITEMFDPSTGVISPEARPLDLALHDLAGMILEIPVFEMLGSLGPKSTLCYSGMIYFDDLEPEDKPEGIGRVLKNCQFDIDYGYRQLKVKIGRGNKWMPRQSGMQQDIEVTRTIAGTFPDIDILVDGNDGFTSDEFIRYLEGVKDVKLFWIEEPFRETLEDYMKLREWLKKNNKKTLLADGEADPTVEFLFELVKKGCLDVVLPDVCGYGFTAWRQLIPAMKRLGAQTSPHAWGDRLKTNYAAHLAAGLGNVVTIEGVTCECQGVDFGDYVLKDGKLQPPASPGFGMHLKL
jgi:D-galactarolactone cycloisomerase